MFTSIFLVIFLCHHPTVGVKTPDDRPAFLPISTMDVKLQQPFPQSPHRKSCPTPLDQVEFPDTTTSDDDVLLMHSPVGAGGEASSSPNSGGGVAAALAREEKPLPRELAHVQCHLEMKELWEKFNDLGTEMIITRSGR